LEQQQAISRAALTKSGRSDRLLPFLISLNRWTPFDRIGQT
jgi:hypothetical protein